MDIIEVIKNRRSVRQYKDKMPEDAMIERILEAGRWAPSGLNNQPWRFMVIKEKNLKDGLGQFTKYAQIIKSAPVIICVFLDISASYNRDKDLMAIGASIQNMCLEAHSLKLGTCWLGEILNRKEQVQQYLAIDADLELLAALALGYPEKDSPTGSRQALKSLLVKTNN